MYLEQNPFHIHQNNLTDRNSLDRAQKNQIKDYLNSVSL